MQGQKADVIMRVDSVAIEIQESITLVRSQYEKLILIAGRRGSGKTIVLRQLAILVNSNVTSISLEMSRLLLPYTTKQRAIKAAEIFNEIVSQSTPVHIFDNMELLFDASLKLDPLQLLRNASRNQIIVASWPGDHSNGRLSYSTFGHSEHYIADSFGVCIHALSSQQD